MEKIKIILDQNHIKYENREFVVAGDGIKGVLPNSTIPFEIFTICQTYHIQTEHVKIELYESEFSLLILCLQKIKAIENLFLNENLFLKKEKK